MCVVNSVSREPKLGTGILTADSSQLTVFVVSSLLIAGGDCSRTTCQLAGLLLSSAPIQLAPCLSLREASAYPAIIPTTTAADNWDFIAGVPSYDEPSATALNATLLRDVQQRLRQESAVILETWLRDKEPLLEQLSPGELLAGIQARLLSGLMDGGVIEPLTATVRPPLVHTAMLLTPTQSCQVRGGSG